MFQYNHDCGSCNSQCCAPATFGVTSFRGGSPIEGPLSRRVFRLSAQYSWSVCWTLCLFLSPCVPTHYCVHFSLVLFLSSLLVTCIPDSCCSVCAVCDFSATSPPNACCAPFSSGRLCVLVLFLLTTCFPPFPLLVTPSHATDDPFQSEKHSMVDSRSWDHSEVVCVSMITSSWGPSTGITHL